MNPINDWPDFFTDQTGRSVCIDKVPKRIISLVPSQSEYLWDIGLQRELVGITKFCIHPTSMFQKLTRVGGTKQLHFEVIQQLNPDLIVGNKEENTIEDITKLQETYPVWLSDINSISDALAMMETLAYITGKQDTHQTLQLKIIEALEKSRNYFKNMRVAYAIWKDPWMFAGSETYIHSVLNHLGFKNVVEKLPRYPELTVEQLNQYDPQVVILSGEPFPFRATHAQDLQKILPQSQVICYSGEPFSWYGSRMATLYDAVLKLEKLIGR